ncbi:MAG: hypothetical protein R3266_02060 [Gemmatimonadota bacterium]|nr:hypothetical protein [Gemmatimonadota bacterium]
MRKLRSWYLAGQPTFVARLAATGFAAGVASWLLALVLYPLFGTRPPNLLELLLAVSLGVLFGTILASGLGAHWDRTSGRDRASRSGQADTLS